MLAAILTGIQTLLRFEERAEKHRTVGARYSALIREIDEALAFADKGREIPFKSVKNIREQYDKISLEAPATSRKVYEKVVEIIKERDKKLKESKK